MLLLPILAGVAVVALVVVIVVLARVAGRHRHSADLGTISDAWIAQHRASSVDVNR